MGTLNIETVNPKAEMLLLNLAETDADYFKLKLYSNE
jgi:hypothetical protein